MGESDLPDHTAMKQKIIRALIPAAGMSRRMNAFKPLLAFGNGTVIEAAVGSLLQAGVRSAVVVTGYRAKEVERVLSDSFGKRAVCAFNKDFETTDMLRSIQIGLSVMEECDAFFLLPGDMPLVSRNTAALLMEEYYRLPSEVLMPAVHGIWSHPPLFDASLIPAVQSYDGSGGMQEFLRREGVKIRVIETGDEGTMTDLDTPEDYASALQKTGGICHE